MNGKYSVGASGIAVICYIISWFIFRWTSRIRPTMLILKTMFLTGSGSYLTPSWSGWSPTSPAAPSPTPTSQSHSSKPYIALHLHRAYLWVLYKKFAFTEYGVRPCTTCTTSCSPAWWCPRWRCSCSACPRTPGRRSPSGWPSSSPSPSSCWPLRSGCPRPASPFRW